MYVRLEEARPNGSLERNDAALGSLGQSLGRLRQFTWVWSLALLALAATLFACDFYERLPEDQQPRWKEGALLASIPFVALFFTWFHIWLAIQMMFRPIEFLGIWQYKDTGLGVGWQGVVPRKAEKMASTAFHCARPYLLGPHVWFAKVDPGFLAAKARPHLTPLVSATLRSVGMKHFPEVFNRMPPQVEEELQRAALDKIQATTPVLWDELAAILSCSQRGIDNDHMVVTVFKENKELLNEFFLNVGKKEFKFIEHTGAAFGFICGLIQLVAFQELNGVGRSILLPSTGFFLGIFTNWLAILVCFKPVFPHPIIFCGRRICTVQGLFIARQPQVSEVYSRMLTDHFFNFSKLLENLQRLPDLWKRLKAVYLDHQTRTFQETLGPILTSIAPRVIGGAKYQELQEDIKMALVQRISEASTMHKEIGEYIASATDIHRSNSSALKSMPPDKFEDLLHPIFKEDEWILILLGGLLGALVGIGQVYFLST